MISQHKVVHNAKGEWFEKFAGENYGEHLYSVSCITFV